MQAAPARIAPDRTFDLSAYDYELPSDRIAQKPLEQRDAARLLVIDRAARDLHDGRVRDLPQLLRPGDLLVLNDTRVIPARVRVHTETGARVELLFLRQTGATTWECLARPARRLRPGRHLELPGGAGGRVESQTDGRLTLRLPDGLDVGAFLQQHGEVPLPPYIRRAAGPDGLDRMRYQTVYAAAPGAVAAPTAGLHFTPELLDAVRRAGVEIAAVTLHVGAATFMPIRASDLRAHRLEAEWSNVPAATANAIARTRGCGGRVLAVGTTTTRALESSLDDEGHVQTGGRWAERYLIPGCRFGAIDGLLTNFHLPRSTLLALVCAFTGRDRILSAYREAVRRGYRFYSYGDAMLIL